MEDKHLSECKRGLSTLVRPIFKEGLLLQDDDLSAGVTYTQQLSRLMFRTLFGCGVLCGLKVSDPTSACGKLKITVGKGVALSCIGDPVEVPKPQTLVIDEPCEGTLGDEIWIALRAHSKSGAPRTTVCSSDEDAPTVCTRERDGFELCAFDKKPECACGCEPVPATRPAPVPAPPPPAPPPPAPPPPAAAPAEPAQVAESATDATTQVQPATQSPAKSLVNADCDPEYLAGDCPCDCCDCEWILLAKLTYDNKNEVWNVDHSVRRFVRPLLMPDPAVASSMKP